MSRRSSAAGSHSKRRSFLRRYGTARVLASAWLSRGEHDKVGVERDRPKTTNTFETFTAIQARADGRYADRRALLGELDLNGPAWQTPDAFDDL